MDESLVLKASEALQKYHCTQRGKGKAKLIDDNPVVSLVIALKKIPDRKFRPLRIVIPHSLHPPGESEVCLFTKADKEVTKQHFQEKGVKCVHKVIPVSKLKTKYKTFEAKRQLSSDYGVYLADKRVYKVLKSLLGKNFFRKKRFPYPVDMCKKDLSEELLKAINATYLHLGLGSCCAIPIARINFPPGHIADNIMRGMVGLVRHIPRGWRNIQSVHLKSTDSIALPLYNSLPPPATLLPAVTKTTPPQVIVLEDSEGEEKEEEKEEEEEEEEKVLSSLRKVKKTRRLAPKRIKGSRVVSAKYSKTLRRRTQ